ncbi:MAG: hypothetical protein V1647_01385 [Pseudomonadota bacterium]
MKYLWNKKGSILAVGALAVLVVVTTLLYLTDVYKSSISVIDEQNRKDAHMLSVAGLYVETLDKVSWVNKQLKRIGMLVAVITFVPQLQPLMAATQKVVKGLEIYQDVLLMRLKVYAPILDMELRTKNKLSLMFNIHYVEYRRRKPLNLFFINIPGLIEFKKEIFETACVKHKGVITDVRTCVNNSEYSDVKTPWFAPTEDIWTVDVKNAY